MWKILHAFFGWDYIQWSNGVDNGVARVHLDGRGVCWYWRYKITALADRITKPEQVLWLTCAPEKYLTPSATFRRGEPKAKPSRLNPQLGAEVD